MVPITTEDWPAKARRPQNAALTCDKFERVFGWSAPKWQTSLAPVVDRLVRGTSMSPRPDRSVSTSWLRGLHVALLVAVSLVVTYYGVVYRGQLPDHPWLMGWNDTFLHVCSFGLLTLLVLPLSREWRAPLAVLAASAVAIEAIQLAIPVRTASLGDLAASLTGIALGAVFVAGVRRGARRLTRPIREEGC